MIGRGEPQAIPGPVAAAGGVPTPCRAEPELGMAPAPALWPALAQEALSKHPWQGLCSATVNRQQLAAPHRHGRQRLFLSTPPLKKPRLREDPCMHKVPQVPQNPSVRQPAHALCRAPWSPPPQALLALLTWPTSARSLFLLSHCQFRFAGEASDGPTPLLAAEHMGPARAQGSGHLQASLLRPAPPPRGSCRHGGRQS